MKPTWDVLGLGAVAVDDLVYVDGYPPPDTKVPIVEERRDSGGLAGTALVTVARLGGRAAYLGVLGDDALSRFAITEMERAGVDCSRVRRRPDARPIHSVIIVDRRTGQRTLFYSLAGVADPEAADITPEVIGACRVLLVDSTVAIAALHAVDVARRAGVPVVADLEHPDGAGVRELVQKVDHLVVGLDFARDVTGARNPEEMLHGLWLPSHTACVVTAGDRGCWYLARETGGDVQHHPARRVNVVDTNGCGDVFHGAYAARIARGDSVASAIAVATVAAGEKATRPGGRQGIPDWPTVSRLLQAHDGEATSGPGTTDAAPPTLAGDWTTSLNPTPNPGGSPWMPHD